MYTIQDKRYMEFINSTETEMRFIRSNQMYYYFAKILLVILVTIYTITYAYNYYLFIFIFILYLSFFKSTKAFACIAYRNS